MTHLKLNKLIKFQNDHIFQHNGFINIDKKYLGTFFKSKKNDCNWTRIHNHLVRKRTWLSVHLRTKLLWVRVQLQSLKIQISRLFRAMSSLTLTQP